MSERLLRAILYSRVSSEEQVRGYSLNQQEEALREHAASEGWEVVDVVRDEGHSGAYLERPGLDRVRDLVEVWDVSVIVSQDADRITRDPGHRMLLDEEFDKHSCKLEALDDWGDNSHEGQLLRFLKGWVSKGERLKIAERTRRGRRQKAKQGLLVAPSTVAYGFVPNPERDGYLVDEMTMPMVRRAFQMIADGAGISGVKGAFEREGVAHPNGWKALEPQHFARPRDEGRVLPTHVRGGRRTGLAAGGRHA